MISLIEMISQFVHVKLSIIIEVTVLILKGIIEVQEEFYFDGVNRLLYYSVTLDVIAYWLQKDQLCSTTGEIRRYTCMVATYLGHWHKKDIYKWKVLLYF